MPLGLEIDSRAPLGPPAWIGYKEAAERLGVSINAIRTMIAKGMLSETRLPIGRPRVSAAEVDAMVAAAYRPRKAQPSRARSG